ncbi:hypothetical protein F5887DRAFT_190525 [Amanita rubescens]|nr:hypothetical protein F5887DRAFT_190525 [Amanita rubescens]
MNRYHDAKQRCRDSYIRADRKYSQPTERQPSEYYFPINRLPQDVLAEVFVQCLPKFESWPSIEGRSTEGIAPLLLCRVCSSWRKLVLSEPRLWQRLSLCFIGTSRTEEVIALIHGWIKRSGVLPLALSLRVVVVVYNDLLVFRAMVEAVLGAFVQYASRWEHFHFSKDDISVTLPEFGDMPRLRSFTLYGDHFEDTKLRISSWPMLAALRWPLHPTASSTPSPPWHQLTHLALGHLMTARETLLVIQSCPKLTEIEIESYYDEGDTQDQAPRIAVVNNSLRKLVLSVDESCTRLLRGLALPVLTNMTLCYVTPCVPRVHRGLLHFFTRSKCKLDRLHLVDPAFDDDMLLRCLKHDSCASITDLFLENIHNDPMVTDAVLAALTDG